MPAVFHASLNECNTGLKDSTPVILQEQVVEDGPIEQHEWAFSHPYACNSPDSTCALLDFLRSQDTDQLLSAKDLISRTTLAYNATSDDASCGPPQMRCIDGSQSSSVSTPLPQKHSDSPLHLSISSAQLVTAPTVPSLAKTGAWACTAGHGLTLCSHDTVSPPSTVYQFRQPPSAAAALHPHYAGMSPLFSSSDNSAACSMCPTSEMHSMDAPQLHCTIQSTFNSAMLSSLISNVQCLDTPAMPMSTGGRVNQSVLNLPPASTSIRSAPPSSLSSQCDLLAAPIGQADPDVSSLSQFVDAMRGSRTAVASVAMLVAETAFALGCMHAQGYVHLQLQLHHVHIRRQDDGCSSPSSSACGLGTPFCVCLSGSPTAHGILLTAPVGGTGFTAPEVAAAVEDAPIPASPAADVYSLAVLAAILLLAVLDHPVSQDVDPADTAALTLQMQALLDSGTIDWSMACILESAWVEDPNLRPTAMQVAQAFAWAAYVLVSPNDSVMEAAFSDARAGDTGDGSAVDMLSDMLREAPMLLQCSMSMPETAAGAPQWLVNYISRRSNTMARLPEVLRSTDVHATGTAAEESRARRVLDSLKRPGWTARAATASPASSGSMQQGAPQEGAGLVAVLRRRASRSQRLREEAFGATVLQDIVAATLKSASVPRSGAGYAITRRNGGSVQVGQRNRNLSRGTPRRRGHARRDGGDTFPDRPSTKSAGVTSSTAFWSLY